MFQLLQKKNSVNLSTQEKRRIFKDNFSTLSFCFFFFSVLLRLQADLKNIWFPCLSAEAAGLCHWELTIGIWALYCVSFLCLTLNSLLSQLFKQHKVLGGHCSGLDSEARKLFKNLFFNSQVVNILDLIIIQSMLQLSDSGFVVWK